MLDQDVGSHRVLLEPLNPESPLSLIMRHWGPPLITIILGGLFASILFPRWQEAYTRARATAQHRLDLTEGLASAFAKYITAWRRLIDIARLGLERPLTETETDRRNAFVADRNTARDALLDLCARGQLYFSDQVCDLIAAFIAWDTDQASKRLGDLPEIAEWRQWEAKILQTLKKEYGGGR